MIELTIVMAIIAVLATIAIPQYNNYVARAQLSEAGSLVGALKMPLTTSYSENDAGSFCALPPNATTQGKYVASISIANSSAAECDVVAKMKPGIAAKASLRILTYHFNPATGTWTCDSDAPTEIVPRACR